MMHFKRPHSNFFHTIVLALVVGAVAGVLAAVATWSSLLSYRTQLILSGPSAAIRIASGSGAAEDALPVLREAIGLSLGDLFLGTENERYERDDAIGRGFALTTDGWFMTHRSVFDPARAADTMVGVNAFVSPVTAVVHDEETGAVFMKLAVENLRAVAFGSSAGLTSGTELYTLISGERLRAVSVDEVRSHASVNTSSDVLESRLTLTEALPRAFGGAPLVNARGEVVGILVLGDDGVVREAVPIDHLTPFISGLLANGSLTRPSLGVRGTSLAGSRRADGGRERGFLLASDPRGGRAVERSLGAARADLEEGDIITKIGDTLLDGTIDLAELLLAWKPSDTVDLQVMRDGVEIVVPVTLGARESGTVIEIKR